MTPYHSAPEEFAPLFRSRQVHMEQDQDVMRQVYELRFEVYCMEYGFLAATDYPNHCEMDEHDARSLHFCAFNLKQELVGYVRLIRADGLKEFPFQRHCKLLFDEAALPEPTQALEISRLMVRKNYRRRAGDILAGVRQSFKGLIPEHDHRSNSPQILLSLYRQIYAYSLKHGVDYWYAAMERSLARIMGRMNFGFQQLGPPTDYYGVVAPYLANIKETENLIGQKNQALLAWMRRSEPNGTPYESAVAAA
jgi:N-acyl amino acid synthase of PEP-CTERM/exosortase system